jgi:hypothetical protein
MSRPWLATVLGLCLLMAGCGVDNSAQKPDKAPPMPTEGPTISDSQSPGSVAPSPPPLSAP